MRLVPLQHPHLPQQLMRHLHRPRTLERPVMMAGEMTSHHIRHNSPVDVAVAEITEITEDLHKDNPNLTLSPNRAPDQETLATVTERGTIHQPVLVLHHLLHQRQARGQLRRVLERCQKLVLVDTY